MAGRPRVVAVGLGPAGPDLLTAAARELLDDPTRARLLRTDRHPAAAAFAGIATCDDVYEASDDLTSTYQTIAARVVDLASDHGDVVYAVPGSPVVAERTVELLLADERVDTEVVPALSFCDLAWARLAVDPVARGVRIVDGHRFAADAAGERGPLLVAQCDRPHVLSDIKLSIEDGPTVTVLQRLGSSDEAIFDVEWPELDRAVEPDHLTTLWIPALASPVAAELVQFVELVRVLRAECPWDREQTHQSLRRHVIEEAYEVAEAIDRLGDDGTGVDALEEELGDLLFQVVFHATLAVEQGWFTLGDVARGIYDKLVSRHPHVFAGGDAETADEVLGSWEELKRAEKGRSSVFDGIPTTLPAVLYGQKALRKGAAIGVTPRGPDDVSVASEADVGGALLALLEQARTLGIDAEAALRAAVDRFVAGARDREGRGEVH